MSTVRDWICSGIGGIELSPKTVQVNYQYDREADDIVNFQVFFASDTQERFDIYEYISIEDTENIRAEILDAIKRGEY